jgi:hypothetical protein
MMPQWAWASMTMGVRFGKATSSDLLFFSFRVSFQGCVDLFRGSMVANTRFGQGKN